MRSGSIFVSTATSFPTRLLLLISSQEPRVSDILTPPTPPQCRAYCARETTRGVRASSTTVTTYRQALWTPKAALGAQYTSAFLKSRSACGSESSAPSNVTLHRVAPSLEMGPRRRILCLWREPSRRSKRFSGERESSWRRIFQKRGPSVEGR